MNSPALRRVLLHAAALALVVWSLFPLYWALNTSLQPAARLGAVPVAYAPLPPDGRAWAQVLSNRDFLRAVGNSLLVGVASTVLALAIGSFAAVALGRYRLPGRRVYLTLILSATFLPQVAVVGFLYRTFVALGLYNTPWAMVASYLLLTVPFTTWVMTGFFAALPRELDEAAAVDGASPLHTLWRIHVPLAAPGLVTTGLLTLMTCWNEYLFALSFTLDKSARTIPVAMAQFTGASRHELPWGQIMAGSLLSTLPLFAVVLAFQDRIASGLTAGAVKG